MASLRPLVRLVPVDMPVGGRRRDRAFALTDPIGRLIGRSDIRTPLGTLSIDWRDKNQRALSYFYYNYLRYYQKSELGRYIAKIARTNETFVDVGANLGFYSIIARLHGMDAVAIEPEPAHAEFLERNERIFGRVLNVAFSDQPGSLPLYSNRSNPGASSLVEAPGFERNEGCVTVTTFSDAVAAEDLGPPGRIRLVKIDVEGHEVQAVRGLDAFLAEGYRPDIWCEVRGAASLRAPNSYLEVTRFFEDRGYVTATADGARVSPTAGDALSRNFIFDLLFTSAEKPAAGPEIK